jgi:hypothetical protein
MSILTVSKVQKVDRAAGKTAAPGGRLAREWK